VNYVHIPIEDESPLPAGQFDSIMDALTENIRWGKVLLHCGVGISRAPSLAAAYMDAVGYKNYDVAIEEIRQLRSIINPSMILFKSIRRHL
jgi:protein-tyrosine phosphatase